MSATGDALAAIVGRYPQGFLRKTTPDPPITATRLSWESPSPEPDVEIKPNGRPRRAAAPTKMMSMGPPIPLIPMNKVRRKHRRKANSLSEEPDEDEDEGREQQLDEKPAKRRSGGKTKEVVRIPADDDSCDEDYDNVDEAVELPPKKRERSKKYMNVRKPPKIDTSVDYPSTESSAKKKGKDRDKSKVPEAKRKADQANALLGRKGKGRAIPTRVEECDPIDLMMWQWRHSGKSWDEIRAEYVRMTGAVPGRSSLSVRLAKMEDNFIDNGGAKDILLLKVKDDVEKELDTLRWQRVAEKMKLEKHPDAHPVTLRKRYMAIKSSGWLLGDSVVDLPATKPKPDLASLLAATDPGTHGQIAGTGLTAFSPYMLGGNEDVEDDDGMMDDYGEESD